MKNDVLIRGSLIPEKDFAIWRRFFGFSLKHFSMVGDTAIYAFRERIQQEIFRNTFCFLIVTGLWVKAFLFFGRIFQRVVNIAFYVSRGHLEVKIIFLKIIKTLFFGKRARNFIIFLPNNSRNDCQKSFVPFQTNKFVEVIFSGKLSFSLFSLDFERITSGSVLKKLSNMIEEQLTKVVYTSNDLILDIAFLILNKSSKISPDKFQQGFPYCNLRVEMNNLRRNIFFWKKLSVSLYSRIFRTMSLDIQRKKNQDFQNCIERVRRQNRLKKKFFLDFFDFAHLFGVGRKHIRIRIFG